MPLYTLGSCQLLTFCSNVLDRLRFFPHFQHSSSLSGCFKIYFLQFLVSITRSCIAVHKPSVSANRSARVSHLFAASMSTCCWQS
jgi:hypothetical protein